MDLGDTAETLAKITEKSRNIPEGLANSKGHKASDFYTGTTHGDGRISNNAKKAREESEKKGPVVNNTAPGAGVPRPLVAAEFDGCTAAAIRDTPGTVTKVIPGEANG